MCAVYRGRQNLEFTKHTSKQDLYDGNRGNPALLRTRCSSIQFRANLSAALLPRATRTYVTCVSKLDNFFVGEKISCVYVLFFFLLLEFSPHSRTSVKLFLLFCSKFCFELIFGLVSMENCVHI
uniref:Uncharacterized protein n=1 Tax=Cacopsylla melanoneura TaxID=428564 RepID=A0A8D8T1G8_9HEMI